MTKLPEISKLLICINVVTAIIGSIVVYKILFNPTQTLTPFEQDKNDHLHMKAGVENAALLEMPLFQPSRKPYTPKIEQTSVQEAPVQPLPLKPLPALVGIIKSGKDSKIILENKENKTFEVLRLGERFDGWKVRAIDSKSATIAQPDSESIQLQLIPESLPANLKEQQ